MTRLRADKADALDRHPAIGMPIADEALAEAGSVAKVVVKDVAKVAAKVVAKVAAIGVARVAARAVAAQNAVVRLSHEEVLLVVDRPDQVSRVQEVDRPSSCQK